MPTARICLDCNHLYTPPPNPHTHTYNRCPNCLPNYLKHRPRGTHTNTPQRRLASAFYKSHRWRQTRQHIINRDGNCTSCGTHDRLQVHHIQSINDAPQLALEPTNLVTLCATCHAHQSNAQRRHDARTRTNQRGGTST